MLEVSVLCFWMCTHITRDLYLGTRWPHKRAVVPRGKRQSASGLSARSRKNVSSNATVVAQLSSPLPSVSLYNR